MNAEIDAILERVERGEAGVDEARVLRAKLARLGSMLSQLEAQRNIANRESALHERQRDEARAECARLRDEHDRLASEDNDIIESTRADLDDARTRIAGLEAECDEARTRIAVLETALAERAGRRCETCALSGRCVMEHCALWQPSKEATNG